MDTAAKPETTPPAAGDSCCPVCAELLPTGSRKCKQCGALRSWTATCESCGAPIPTAATICHECGRYPKNGRLCGACGRPLSPNARTCGDCGALQWGRGSLQLSQATLALLVALVSAVTSLIAVVTALGPFANSRTTLSYLGIAPDVEHETPASERQFTLVATNDGNRPARVIRGQLTIKGGPTMGLDIVKPELDQRIVGGGEQISILFELPSWDLSRFGIAKRNVPAFGKLICRPKTLAVVVKEYRGEQTREIAVPARDLEKLLCRAANTGSQDVAPDNYCEVFQPCISPGASPS